MATRHGRSLRIEVAGNRPPILKPTSEEESVQRDAKVTALLSDTGGGSPPTSAAHAVDSFPTEQRNRQKAKQKAGHVAKKRPQVVEDHHDDCGEDFGRLGGDDYFTDNTDSFYEGMEPLTDDSDDEDFILHTTDLGMNGSEFVPETPEEHSLTSAMYFEDFESFNTWNSTQNTGVHDVAELCGGAGGTGTLLVRRGYK